MEEANKPIRWAYFMESGIASVVAKSNRHKQVEAGIIGREGMTALMVVMGDHRSPNDTYIQVAGSARPETRFIGPNAGSDGSGREDCAAEQHVLGKALCTIGGDTHPGIGLPPGRDGLCGR